MISLVREDAKGFATEIRCIPIQHKRFAAHSPIFSKTIGVWPKVVHTGDNGCMGKTMNNTSVWHNRDFRWLWLGTMFIRLGSQVAVIAVTWLVLKTTGSGAKLGLVLALYAAGDMGASPFIGIMLDRLPRKVLLQADNLCLGTIWVLLALLSRWHMLSLPLLILLVTVSGALTPIAYLGRMMVLPNIVSGDLWESANTWMQLNMNLVILLGPALGGVYWDPSPPWGWQLWPTESIFFVLP